MQTPAFLPVFFQLLFCFDFYSPLFVIPGRSDPLPAPLLVTAPDSRFAEGVVSQSLGQEPEGRGVAERHSEDMGIGTQVI